MVHVVALLARAGHGKTTAANYLRDTYGAAIVSLAGPLKRVAKKVMKFNDGQLWGTQEEKEAIDSTACDSEGDNFSARRFLQLLGTEGLREEFGQDIHADALMRSINAHYSKANGTNLVYVVDDARFPSEISYFRALTEEQPWVIKLVCTDAPPSGNDNHPSERGCEEVPSEHINVTITSSRAVGTEDLIAKLEQALDGRLRPLKNALLETKARKAA